MKEYLNKEINIKKVYLLIILFLITIIDLILLLNASVQKYSVTFVDYDNVYTYVVKKNTKIESIKNENLNFLGWYNGDVKFDFNTKINENIVLKAKYEEITSYKVTFNTSGGTEIDAVFVKKGDTIKKPEDPEKENYTFITWNLNDEEFDFETKINKNIILNAVWQEVDEDKKIYTITFDSSGGSIIEPLKIKANDYANKPINPTKEGYNFAGWYLNGKTFSWNFPIKSSFTLVAKWQKKATVKLTFNANGGNYIKPLTIYKNEATKLPIPERDGYVFNGWYYRTKKYTDTTKITSSIKLTAKWITIDQANLIAALKNINSSYEITNGGTKISIVKEGCTISNTNSNVLNNIKRNLVDTKVTLYFSVQCGTAKKTVKSIGIIKASTYTYEINDLELKINGTNLDGEIFKLDGTKIANVLAGKVKLNNMITGNIILVLRDDQKTSYVLKRI